jgi:prevent-host-death family protein
MNLMPDEIGAYEAKTHLPALLERVQRGEQITITKHGKPIARLVPIRRSGPDRRSEAIDKLKEFAEGHTLGIPVRQLIDEGRR